MSWWHSSYIIVYIYCPCMRFWNKYIYDIPELVGDTILQIEGNISFVVLLLMLLLCLLALPCNLRYWMNAYLHRHCNDFIPDYGFICCVFFVCSLFTMGDVCSVCVCVCSTVAECYRPPKSHDYTSLSSWVFKFYILSILWEWQNFRCSHHR